MLGRTEQEGAASDVSKYWWGERGRGRPLTITVARDVFMERLERRNNNIEFHCGLVLVLVVLCIIVSDFIELSEAHLVYISTAHSSR